MQIIRSCKELSELTKIAHDSKKCIGLVPTMGYLHNGHRSLIHTMRKKCDLLIVSDFVNPTQFGPNEDYATYPKDHDADARLCESEKVDILFLPSPEEMYPNGQGSTWVEVQNLGNTLCGAQRPGHFRGVATVVIKLFLITRADKAAFGEKDFQQLTIIRRMVEDLNIPIEIIPCPIIREPDGLALSSRNIRLSPQGRTLAPNLHKALLASHTAYLNGEHNPQTLLQIAQKLLEQTPEINTQYLELVDANTLQNYNGLPNESPVMLVAAFVDNVRLIDNQIF